MSWGLKRYYGEGSLHFITWSCYQRQPLLGTVIGSYRPYAYGESGLVRINDWSWWEEEDASRCSLRCDVHAKAPTSRKEREKWGTRF